MAVILLNSAGEVIGINSNKIGGSAIEGMGYAIPISDAEPIIQKLMEKQTRSKVAESEVVGAAQLCDCNLAHGIIADIGKRYRKHRQILSLVKPLCLCAALGSVCKPFPMRISAMSR